jgi:hypothetical protein
MCCTVASYLTFVLFSLIVFFLHSFSVFFHFLFPSFPPLFLSPLLLLFFFFAIAIALHLFFTLIPFTLSCCFAIHLTTLPYYFIAPWGFASCLFTSPHFAISFCDLMFCHTLKFCLTPSLTALFCNLLQKIGLLLYNVFGTLKGPNMLIWLSVFRKLKCRNLSLGLTTKTRGLQGCGLRERLGSHITCSRSAKSVKEWTLTLPSELPCWELESQMNFRIFKARFQGSKPISSKSFLYHWKHIET